VTGIVLHVLAVLGLLVVVAFVLTYGIRAMMHDGWTRLAWAVMKLSEAAPRAAEALARVGDRVAAWLMVRAIKDAPRTTLRRPPVYPSVFGPAPKPDGEDPAAVRSDLPSAAELTAFDTPIDPDRPYVDGPPFGATVAAAMTMTMTGSDAR
jgi:hypothetical protein